MSEYRGKSPKKQPIKVLIVEDEFFSRQFLKDTLSPYGRVDIAVNGQETLEAFSHALDGQDPYHLICLDILMPVMDGQETLKKIRGIEKQRGIMGLDGVKVIMVTGVEDNRNVLDAFRSGCEGYLKKPIDEDKLLSLLEKLELID